jgi:agarase
MVLLILWFLIPLSLFPAGYKSTNGFFSVKNFSGRWFLVDPDNNPFFSIGISRIDSEDRDYKLGARHYNGIEKINMAAWVKEAIQTVTNLGFNTIGCWSSPEITKMKVPYFIIIEFKKKEKDKLVDVFSTDFEKMIESAVEENCSKRSDDPYLVGYFIGNDLNWYGDYSFYMGHTSYLFDIYFDLDGSSAGKKKVIEFLEARYGTIGSFNSAWNLKISDFKDIANLKMSQFNIKDINAIRTEFLSVVAERFYSLMTEKIKAADKNHLIFSDRFANSVPEQVLRISGKFCDAVSFNYYKNLPDVDKSFLETLYETVNKPILISEFTFRSMDNTSGLKNRIGPDTTVASQEDRGKHYKVYTGSFARLPFVIGYHWFQFFDDPQDGRASNDEDNNYGIVDESGRPYKALMDAMREANPLAFPDHKTVPLTKLSTKKIFYIPRIKVRAGTKNSAFEPVYLDSGSLQNNIVTPWGDQENNARMTVQKVSSRLILWYSSGYGWGCGATIFSVSHNMTGYYDASGYKGIKFRMSLPPKVRFFIYLNESGVKEPWQKSYQGANGADGESYSSDEAYGTGRIEDYYFDFDTFNIRPVWGNQTGNKTIDLQAVNDFEISLPGRQNTGTAVIEKIELY